MPWGRRSQEHDVHCFNALKKHLLETMAGTLAESAPRRERERRLLYSSPEMSGDKGWAYRSTYQQYQYQGDYWYRIDSSAIRSIFLLYSLFYIRSANHLYFFTEFV